MVVQDPITQKVVQALADDPRTANLRIEVTSQGGVVTLIGQVPDPKLPAIAEEIARRQPGVVSVINSLQILPARR